MCHKESCTTVLVIKVSILSALDAFFHVPSTVPLLLLCIEVFLVFTHPTVILDDLLLFASQTSQ